MNQLWKKQIATGLLIAISLMAQPGYAAKKLSAGDDAAIGAGATAVVAATAGGAYLATRPKPGAPLNTATEGASYHSTVVGRSDLGGRMDMEGTAAHDVLSDVDSTTQANTLSNSAYNTSSEQGVDDLGVTRATPGGQGILTGGRAGLRAPNANSTTNSNEIRGTDLSTPRSPTRVGFGNIEVAGNVDAVGGGTTSDPTAAGTRILQNLAKTPGAGETPAVLREGNVPSSRAYVDNNVRTTGTDETTAEIRARQAIEQMNAQETAPDAEASIGPSETSNQLNSDGTATENNAAQERTNSSTAASDVADTNARTTATNDASAGETGGDGGDGGIDVDPADV
jgi:hypothetical protein